MLLTQVARALGLDGDFDGALLQLNALTAADPELAVRIPLERGRVLNSSGSPDAARPLFETALALATAAGLEFLAIDALHMVAIVALPSEQEGLNRQALALAATADDPRARLWRGSLLNNLGWTLFARGDYAEALGVFEDALVARTEQGKAENIQVARWCVARVLRALERFDEALAIQQALATEHAAAGTSDPYVQEELAELQSALTAEAPPTPPQADPRGAL